MKKPKIPANTETKKKRNSGNDEETKDSNVVSHPPVKYTGPDTKVDDHEYCSDELGSSDPDDSDEDSGPKNLKFRRSQLNKDFKFEKDMEFNTLNDFRFAIRHWNILNGFTLDWVKNESYRVRVVCSRKCGYFVYCSQVGHKHTYAIKTMGKAHTCGRDTSNKSASSKWVAHNIMDKMQTTQKLGIRDIIQDIRRNYAVDITKGKALRAKKIASKIIERDGDKQYAMIRRYAAELRRVSKANTIKINVERPNPTLLPRFGSFYFCFEVCKKGFIHGCRPFIGVDGCHLKTKNGGQLLIVVGRDPNDQYFPLAFGVVETETKESWRWFLQLLMEDLGEDKRYVFISDQQKGLVAVFDEMFDRIEHRVCLRHLYANFKKKFGGGTHIRDLMMGAAKATYYQGWLQKMNELKVLDAKAWEWLMAIPTKTWCKHAFSFYSKCDVLMNNISESFNATILVARDKPILTMCEWIRNYLMNRMSTSSSKLEKWEQRIMPMPMRRLDKEIYMSGQL
ncbi:hypothetical protein QL285_045960 [Trifolium repens]|nr:hypothetical protein QL285_045960 [Trifolium repens]